MKKAISLYEELKDTYSYICSSWLHAEMTDSTNLDAYSALGAASFLFDNLFAKQNAGKEITEAVAFDLTSKFKPQALSALATKMRLNMSGDEFSLGTSPLRDYLKWVAESDAPVNDAYKDNLGRLVLVTAEEVTNLIVTENRQRLAPMHVAEIVFLTFTETFRLQYMELLGPKFKDTPSYLYFQNVAEEMERIRGELAD